MPEDTTDFVGDGREEEKWGALPVVSDDLLGETAQATEVAVLAPSSQGAALTAMLGVRTGKIKEDHQPQMAMSLPAVMPLSVILNLTASMLAS